MKKSCGLDVHKGTIFCAIYDGKLQSEVKEFSTTTISINNMGEYLQSENVEEIAMESTGIYWIPVWNILEEMTFNLMLVNPYLIKQMPGRKSDIKDAQWISILLHKGMLRGSLIPCKEIRELRTYSRKYIKLQQRQVSVLQELERTLELCGIRITSLVSNISGKSVQKIIYKIIEGEDNAEELLKQVHGRISNKHGKEKVIEALTGFVLPHHRFILEQTMEEYELLLRQSERLLSKMNELCKLHYSKEFELLITIPGVSDISAMILIAETGADMKAFENSGKFTGWIGLRPRNDESAGKYKSTATTKGNKYLRAMLVQIAWAAIKTKNSDFKDKFNRLSMRKSRKKALIAIARKIAVVTWNILKTQKTYSPNILVVLQKEKVQAKLNYHQKEFEKLEKIISCLA